MRVARRLKVVCNTWQALLVLSVLTMGVAVLMAFWLYGNSVQAEKPRSYYAALGGVCFCCYVLASESYLRWRNRKHFHEEKERTT